MNPASPERNRRGAALNDWEAREKAGWAEFELARRRGLASARCGPLPGQAALQTTRPAGRPDGPELYGDSSVAARPPDRDTTIVERSPVMPH